MKRFAPSLWLLLLASTNAWSQECTQCLFLQQNKTIEVTLYNKKGEPTGKQVYTVSGVANSGGITTGTVNTQTFDKKDRPTTSSTNTIKCTGGVLQLDMKLMLPEGPAGRFSNFQASGNGGILEYPSGMKTGDTLKSGNMVLSNGNNNGPGGSGAPPGPPPPPNPFAGNSTLTMWVYDRKVLGQESVTTTAGTWNCMKISYKCKVSFKTGPFPNNINIEGTEWYAPGVGIVKTQSDHGGTAVTSVK